MCRAPDRARRCGTTGRSRFSRCPGLREPHRDRVRGRVRDREILAGGHAVPAHARQPVEQRRAVGRGVVEVARAGQHLALPASAALRQRIRSRAAGATPAAARAELIAVSSERSARERCSGSCRLRAPCAEGCECGERAGDEVPPTHPGESRRTDFGSALLFYRNLAILQRVLSRMERLRARTGTPRLRRTAQAATAATACSIAASSTSSASASSPSLITSGARLRITLP